MRIVATLLLTLSLYVDAAPVCVVGSGATAWRGSPADLAGIEAVHQRTQAEQAGRAYPNGSTEPSPWSFLVTCREMPAS